MPASMKPNSATVEEAAKMHREGGYVLIDIRMKDEYDFSHVMQAVNCPYLVPTLMGLGSAKSKTFLDQFLKNVPLDTKVLIMGKNGSQAKSAAHDLIKAGYTCIVHVDGGVMAWQQFSVLVKSAE